MKFHLKNTSSLNIQVFYFIFAVVSVLLFLSKAIKSLHKLAFTDETEKFVGAQMIDIGYRLYDTVFAHHGPLSYIIAHLYTQIVSADDFTYIRLVMIFLALVTAMAIYNSPALINRKQRLLSISIYLSLLTSIWLLHAINMILYQHVAGFMFSVAISQLFIPLFTGGIPSKWGAFSSGFCLVLMCFAAYSLGPSVVLATLAIILLIASAKYELPYWRLVLSFFAGSTAALIFVLLWLVYFADLKGYLIYHFYFNQEIYSQFINFKFSDVGHLFSFSLQSSVLIHDFTLFALLTVLLNFIRLSFISSDVRGAFSSLISLLLFFLSIILLDPRGLLDFQENTLIIVVFSISAISFPLFAKGWGCKRNNKLDTGIFIAAVLFVVALSTLSKYARSTPSGVVGTSKFDMHYSDESKYQLIRRLAHNGRILVLPFDPEIYIKAGLLPASGNYYYLPWQARYNLNPVDGYKIDLCHDISKNKPSIIYFNHRKVWGYSLPEYEPCFVKLLDSEYVYIGESIYIKSTLVSDYKQLTGRR